MSEEKPYKLENGHEYVDLGLPSGTLWAKENISLDYWDLYGTPFMWGSIESENDMKTLKGFSETPNNISGNLTHDIATKEWGGKWVIPSKAHFEELEQNCKKTIAIKKGREGWKFIGPNGKSIFLPSGGIEIIKKKSMEQGKICAYWTSTKFQDTLSAYAFYIWDRDVYHSNKGNGNYYLQPIPVECKALIRPIIEGKDKCDYIDRIEYNPVINPEISEPSGEINGHPYVDLGLGSLKKWAYTNLGAKEPSNLGDLFHWGAVKSQPAESIKGEYREERDEEEVDEINYLLFQVGLNSITNIDGIDAATSIMGHDWHLPERKDLEELIGSCDWIPAKIGNVFGFKIVGPNGNSIFIPFNMTNLFGGEFGIYMSADIKYDLVIENIKEYIWKYDNYEKILGVRAVSDFMTEEEKKKWESYPFHHRKVYVTDLQKHIIKQMLEK